MHMRTVVAAAVVGLSLACTAGLANAQQIYKWKDANGVTHFSQSPPCAGTHFTKMHLTGEPEVTSNPAPSAPVDDSEPETSAPQRSAAASGTQADTPANRAELCKQLGSNISLLQGKQPVVTGGADGTRQVMSDSARQQQLSTARAQQAQYCSGGGSA